MASPTMCLSVVPHAGISFIELLEQHKIENPLEFGKLGSIELLG